MTIPPKNFSDLTFDSMYTATARNDRNTTLRVGVYMGRPTFSIFTGQGGRPFKIPLPPQCGVLFRALYGALRKQGPDSKISFPIREWDPQQKKMVDTGHVTVGIDSTGMGYIGIQASGIAAQEFVFRPNMKWDISGVAEVNANALALDTFLAAIDNIQNGINLTNFKFDPSQRPGGGGGGNRGNYSGGGGGGSYGGGGGQPRQQPAPAQNADIDDDIPF